MRDHVIMLMENWSVLVDEKTEKTVFRHNLCRVTHELVMCFPSKVFYKQKTCTKCVVYQKHATVRNNRAQISQNKELSQVVNWTSHITLQHITLQQTLFQWSTLAYITTVVQIPNKLVAYLLITTQSHMRCIHKALRELVKCSCRTKV